MREELRTEIVKALHVAATRLPDLPDLSADLDKLALEVGTELKEGDEVECPTSKYNERFINEPGVETGDLVQLIVDTLGRGVGEVVCVSSGPGWQQVEIEFGGVRQSFSPTEFQIVDRSGRARTMHVAYVSWHDDVVVLVDDDGCNAEIVTHAKCTRVARS